MKTMRNAALKLLVFIISFVCVDSVIVRAEYLIVKKENNDFRALNKQESLRHGNAIGKILLKYQWPMCTTQHFSDEELSEIYKSVPHSSVNGSNLEETFIQKKLQELDPDLYVVFIPTSVYELFCIVQFFEHQQKNDTSFNKVASTIFDYDQALREDDYVPDYHLFFIINFLDILNPVEMKDLKQEEANNNSVPYEVRTDFSNATVADCYKALNDIFNRINDVFYVTNPEVFQKLSPVRLLTKNDETAFFYINNTLINELLRLYPDCKNSVNFVKKMKDNCLNFIGFLNKKFKAINSLEKMRLLLGSDFTADENCIGTLDNNLEIVSEVMKLEYEAYYCNKALILRGTSFEKFETGIDEIQPLLGSTAYKPKDSSIIKAYATENIKPYSISFANSLFAGVFLDCGSCALNFLQGGRVLIKNNTTLYHNIGGYGLLIDKKQYMDNFNAQLFYIQGISSLAALFQSGFSFHPRTKIAVSSKQQQVLRHDHKIEIEGIEVMGRLVGIEDPNHLLIITRDPLKQAELFEKYIAENGRLIQASSELSPEGKSAREKLATSAKDAAEYHHALQTTVPKLKKYVQSYKERKTQAKQPKQDVGKQGKQPKTVPAPIKNPKLLINALELASMLKK